jgi:hypothetical protein
MEVRLRLRLGDERWKMEDGRWEMGDGRWMVEEELVSR